MKNKDKIQKTGNRIYSERVILIAARLYASGMPQAEISRQMNIPEKTIRYWIWRLKQNGMKNVKAKRREQWSFRKIVELINDEIDANGHGGEQAR